MDRPHNPTNALKYFDNMYRMSLFDAFTLKHDCARSNFPSYVTSQSSSRIDYIWTSTEVSVNILDCFTIPLSINISDHLPVITKFTNFLDIKFNKRKKLIKSSFNFSKMNEQRWSHFENKLDALLNGCALKTINANTFWTQSLLNRHWDQFQELLIKSAEMNIPIKKSSGQFKYPRPPNLSKLYTQQKDLHKFIKLLHKVKSGASFPISWTQSYKSFINIANALNF